MENEDSLEYIPKEEKFPILNFDADKWNPYIQKHIPK